MPRVLFTILLLFQLSPAASVTCLDEASSFAERICGQIQTSGSRKLTEVNGQLKAEVSGIVSKVLGGASAEINAKRLKDVYENVLREDLAKELFNVRECRIKMVEVGRAEACKSVVRYKACRHPDFGIDGWQKVEEFDRRSGWTSEGPSPEYWCRQMIDNYVSSRKLGPYYEARVMLYYTPSNSKDSREGTVYDHWCSVEVKSIPLYAEKSDPRCGVVGK